jgi:hypothetical protein
MEIVVSGIDAPRSEERITVEAATIISIEMITLRMSLMVTLEKYTEKERFRIIGAPMFLVKNVARKVCLV